MTGSARRKSPAPVCQLAGAAEIKGADFDGEDTPPFRNFQQPFRPPSLWPVIGDVPAGFNPVKFPILARHWFGSSLSRGRPTLAPTRLPQLRGEARPWDGEQPVEG